MLEVSVTKRKLADKLIELSGKKALASIKVKDLCEACGVQRQSFYYHFKDKYDLIAWIYVQDFYYALEHSESLQSEEMIRTMLKKISENKNFYKSAYQEHTQNCLGEYLIDMYVDMEEKVLKKHLDTDSLSKEQKYELRSYSYACLEHSRAWICGETELSIDEFAHLLYKETPELLKKAYED